MCAYFSVEEMHVLIYIAEQENIIVWSGNQMKCQNLIYVDPESCNYWRDMDGRDGLTGLPGRAREDGEKGERIQQGFLDHKGHQTYHN